MRILAMLGACAGVLSLAAAGEASAGTIRGPASVVSNSGGDFSGTYDIGQTIDQSGLSAGYTNGVTDFATYVASHTLVAAGNEWFAPSGVTSSVIIYDMGASYTLLQLALWNEDVSGITRMVVETSDDVAFGTFNSVGTFHPTDNAINVDYYAEVFDLTDSTARYVRLSVLGPSPYVSMGEIAFDTAVVPLPPAALMGLTLLGGLGLTRVLRTRRQAVSA